jgi:SWI/SNF chromatin-remodeling complex subunit SWI1
MSPPSPSRDGPRRRRVEYLPLLRDIDTDGGREHRRIATSSFQVSIDDWGALEIDALTMSIRSRIGVEVSYALTTLTVLSIMRGGASGFPIHQCPELLDEILELAEEAAFGDEPVVPIALDDDIVTYKQLVQAILDDGEKLFCALEPHQGQKPLERGPLQRPADIVLAVLNVLRNLSVIPENREFLARHERVLPVCMRLCGVRRNIATGALRAAGSAFSLTDLASVRRDVLYLLVNLGNAVLLAPNLVQAPSVAAVRVGQSVFDLVGSYVLEPGLLSPYTVMVESGVRTPPALVDAALEVFTRFALPDVNRKVISRTVPERWQRAVFVGLVHRLPLSDVDFQLMREESWLSHLERAIMALYTLAFLAGPDLKRTYRADRALGVPRLFLRLVKKLTVGVSQSMRVYYNVCARRAVETLKVLDDAVDAFETAQATGGPPLAFGMGYADGEQDAGDKGSGMLSGFQEDVLWTVMMQKEVSGDECMFHELESLARVGMPVAA